MKILAIDPGNTDSAYVVVDSVTRRPLQFAKLNNVELLIMLRAGDFADCDQTAVEMVASYGMPVGADVFETCVWIGRFVEVAVQRTDGPVETVKRHPVKLHHCHSAKAKDSNIIQALVDRFAPGEPNRGKGTKAQPGWFYGFAADVWQAYALAVHVADTLPTDAVAAPAPPPDDRAATVPPPAQEALL